MNKLSQLLFGAACLIAVVAVVEKLMNMLGYTLVFLRDVAPSQLLEWTSVVLLFVIALEVRGWRRSGSGSAG